MGTVLHYESTHSFSLKLRLINFTFSGFQWSETASFLNGLPPGMFGLEGWNETDMLTKVLAASQQEYFDSLKKKQQQQETPGGQDKRDEEDSTKSDNKQKSKSSSPSKSNH